MEELNELDLINLLLEKVNSEEEYENLWKRKREILPHEIGVSTFK